MRHAAWSVLAFVVILGGNALLWELEPTPVAAQIAPAGSPGIGDTRFFNSQGLTATVVAYKTSGGTVATIDWTNGGTACFLQFFNAPTTSVTLGSTAPTLVFALAANTSRTINLSVPFLFSSAISLASTTTATGSTGCQPTNVSVIGQ